MKYSNNDALAAEIISQTQGLEAEQLLEYMLARFGDRIALASSFGAEDQVLTDMLCRICDKPNIFTLDTGRLAEQSYELFEKTNKKYSIKIQVLFPDYRQIEEMVNKFGPNLFYDSVENRKLCCRSRKIEPLKRKLSKLYAWICGLRAEQSMTRKEQEKVEWDQAFGLIKISPLARWSTERVWDYIHKHDVPYNKLHDKGYPSIGCEPCTRAVKPGEDIRAGRWWWEEPEHKECGLHLGSGNKKPDEDSQK